MAATRPPTTVNPITERGRPPATINGAAGVLVLAGGRPLSVMGFTVVGGRVAAIDVLTDPDRLGRLDLRALLGT